MKQLQRVQNSLARVVCKTSKFFHITRVFYWLHWLKIECIIVFEIDTFEYKTLHTSKPVLTFGNYWHCRKKQRTRASGTRELIRSRFLKSRLVLVISILLLRTSGITFLYKYKQLRRIPSSAIKKQNKIQYYLINQTTISPSQILASKSTILNTVLSCFLTVIF